MRLSLIVPIVGCTALAALGCGSGSSGPDTLTCDWLASSANCWKSTALMATTCLPPSTDSGTFSADNSSCTYTSGYTISFTPAVVLPLPSNPTWNFTVNDPTGQPCLRYQDSNNGNVKLVVGSQTVSVTTAGFSETITCPDGTSVHAANALNLLSCGDGGFLDSLPGNFYGYTDTSVDYGLAGTGNTTLSVFNCSK